MIFAGLFAVLFLHGCGPDIKALGGGPWPVYGEPAKVQLDDAEAKILIQFSIDHPELFKKIQGSANAWRAIVLEHNKAAIDINRKRLEALGFTDKDLEAIRGRPK